MILVCRNCKSVLIVEENKFRIAFGKDRKTIPCPICHKLSGGVMHVVETNGQPA